MEPLPPLDAGGHAARRGLPALQLRLGDIVRAVEEARAVPGVASRAVAQRETLRAVFARASGAEELELLLRMLLPSEDRTGAYGFKTRRLLRLMATTLARSGDAQGATALQRWAPMPMEGTLVKGSVVCMPELSIASAAARPHPHRVASSATSGGLTLAELAAVLKRLSEAYRLDPRATSMGNSDAVQVQAIAELLQRRMDFHEWTFLIRLLLRRVPMGVSPSIVLSALPQLSSSAAAFYARQRSLGALARACIAAQTSVVQPRVACGTPFTPMTCDALRAPYLLKWIFSREERLLRRPIPPIDGRLLIMRRRDHAEGEAEHHNDAAAAEVVASAPPAHEAAMERQQRADGRSMRARIVSTRSRAGAGEEEEEEVGDALAPDRYTWYIPLNAARKQRMVNLEGSRALEVKSRRRHILLLREFKRAGLISARHAEGLVLHYSLTVAADDVNLVVLLVRGVSTAAECEVELVDGPFVPPPAASMSDADLGGASQPKKREACLRALVRSPSATSPNESISAFIAGSKRKRIQLVVAPLNQDAPPSRRDVPKGRTATKRKAAAASSSAPKIAAQVKFDGDRLQAHLMLGGGGGGIRLFTKNGHDVSSIYSDICGPAALGHVAASVAPCILDGELIVVHRGSDVPLAWSSEKWRYNTTTTNNNTNDTSGAQADEDEDDALKQQQKKQNKKRQEDDEEEEEAAEAGDADNDDPLPAIRIVDHFDPVLLSDEEAVHSAGFSSSLTYRAGTAESPWDEQQGLCREDELTFLPPLLPAVADLEDGKNTTKQK